MSCTHHLYLRNLYDCHITVHSNSKGPNATGFEPRKSLNRLKWDKNENSLCNDIIPKQKFHRKCCPEVASKNSKTHMYNISVVRTTFYFPNTLYVRTLRPTYLQGNLLINYRTQYHNYKKYREQVGLPIEITKIFFTPCISIQNMIDSGLVLYVPTKNTDVYIKNAQIIVMV
jgi:hypothetical protein